MTTRAQRLVVTVGALALTLLVTWPLPRCFGTCLGEPPDTLLSIYFLNWVAHALTTPGVRLLDAPMFAPYHGTLALGEYILAYAPLAIPSILATGNPIVAHNVVLVAAYTLAALGAAALAARLVAGPASARGAAIAAGLVFGYSPRLLHQAYNLQTLSVFWLPWLFLALERFLARPTWPMAVSIAGLALGLALSSMNVFVYTGVAVVVFLGVAIAAGRGPVRRAHVVRLAVAAVPAAALLGAYLAPYRTAAREWRLARTLAEVERHSASLRDYPSLPREELLRHLVGLDPAGGVDLPGLLPGITVAVLAAAGLAVFGERDGLRRSLLPYVAVAGVAAVLALGPMLHTPWGPVALPYRVLYEVVPGFAATRTPARFLVLVELTLGLLAAAGAARLVRPLHGRRRTGVLAAIAVLVLAESVAVPFPGTVLRLDPAAVPEVYRWLATREPRTVALTVPMGDWANVAAAAFHRRRTVDGWSSFLPPHYAALAEAMEAFPDARSVALVQGVRPDLVLVDRAWLTPARAAALAAPAVGLRLAMVFPTHLVYRPDGAWPPGVEALEATAHVDVSGSGGPPHACVTLRNPTPRFVPLYPVRVLRLEAAPGNAGVSIEEWLPLALAPGADHRTCLGPGSLLRGFRIRGTVRGAGQVHRFTVTPAGPPAAPTPDRSG